MARRYTYILFEIPVFFGPPCIYQSFKRTFAKIFSPASPCRCSQVQVSGLSPRHTRTCPQQCQSGKTCSLQPGPLQTRLSKWIIQNVNLVSPIRSIVIIDPFTNSDILSDFENCELELDMSIYLFIQFNLLQLSRNQISNVSLLYTQKLSWIRYQI